MSERCPNREMDQDVFVCRATAKGEVPYCEDEGDELIPFTDCVRFQRARAEAAEQRVAELAAALEQAAQNFNEIVRRLDLLKILADKSTERLRRAEEVMDAVCAVNERIGSVSTTFSMFPLAQSYRRDYPAEPSKEKEGEG